jgi:bifunctional N-acetylglucosamine-1-phosphate-uridyltransferase/glucosamine-1-phosphate-acetyltransferase GlmU-like protein
MAQIIPASELFDLTRFAHRALFREGENVWEALSRLKDYLVEHLDSNVTAVGSFGAPLPKTVVLWDEKVWFDGFEILGGDAVKGTLKVRIRGTETTEATILYAGCVLMDPRIQIGRGSVVEPGALIKGPTIIGNRTEVRQGAYIRGTCLIGDRCVVGHTTEVKSSIFLDGAKAGHFAYIGDSILGNDVNLGAGTKLANLKIKGNSIRIRAGEDVLDTGRRKLGAIVGDGTEIGCNAVTNPGTVLGRRCLVCPVLSVRAGVHPARTVIR